MSIITFIVQRLSMYMEMEKRLNICTYISNLTASAIIASTTTSAIAEPKFCTVNKTLMCHLELLKNAFKPRTGHGTRERTVAITR